MENKFTNKTLKSLLSFSLVIFLSLFSFQSSAQCTSGIGANQEGFETVIFLISSFSMKGSFSYTGFFLGATLALIIGYIILFWYVCYCLRKTVHMPFIVSLGINNTMSHCYVTKRMFDANFFFLIPYSLF